MDGIHWCVSLPMFLAIEHSKDVSSSQFVVLDGVDYDNIVHTSRSTSLSVSPLTAHSYCTYTVYKTML